MTVVTRPVDVANERAVADVLERVWQCSMHRYGFMDSLDWWIERRGKTVGYAELKARDVELAYYPTVYLALRKWLALQLAALTGPSGLFVVRFTDAMCFANVHDIDARRITVAGRSDRPDMPNDREPIIEVPIATMTVIE